jgi:squalene-associated FAD-dependent desaturase
MTSTVHVIGAGLAGLAAAIRLVQDGKSVVIHEASGAAGGRCRSYDDPELGCRLDNGNHLLLSGNTCALDYLTRIGARDTLGGPAEPAFPFLDLRNGSGWTLRLNPGPLPLWLFSAKRRVPGSRIIDYARGLRLKNAEPEATVASILADDPALFARFWQPFAVAALNTEVETASARALWDVVRQSFGRGGGACRPLVPVEGLSVSFVDPALAFLGRNGTEVRFRRRLRGIGFENGSAASLDFGGEIVRLGPSDRVVLAVPPWIAGELIPGLAVPNAHRSILNVHFRTSIPGFEWPDFLGLVGGLAEWVFAKPGVVSVTVSAADEVIDRPADVLAARVWVDLKRAFRLDDPVRPPSRVVKEKRATFATTPDQLRLRPGSRIGIHNLVLAGDWTRTGLPATIEGAVSSGYKAAQCLLEAF